MNLTDKQLLRLHLEDGMVVPDTVHGSEDVGFDPDVDLHFRQQVRRALRPEVIPSLVDNVMARIASAGLPVGDAIREQGLSDSALSESVMGSLGFGSTLRTRYKEALVAEAGEAPTVWPSVAAAIGVDTGFGLGSVLREAVQSEAEYNASSRALPQRAQWRTRAIVGAVVAMAAAVLLWVGSAGTTATDVVEKIAEGPIHIEHLDVGAANAVRVLDLGDDAPTIILLQDTSSNSEGEK